ncbi:type II toxin-antitoxin system VapC family toxin [Rhizobium lusitanum]|uniref:type II toxin-antitoxin system VapC family toxin n=1 Tax=Rhizobium lusitanum TaxID=293958 RepID=UPI00161528F7|nr:type II toxin-antitoxin system VapC family toxin [Rhizobium lusitanum]QND49232.1 type II toxin-antitoxin system VapC family toxin [Rhizobium lusitanum]
MKGYLLDTNVVSMLLPTKRAATPAFLDWLRARYSEDTLFLSVITVQEIEKGAEKLATVKGGSQQRAALIKAWLEELIGEYGDRILPIDMMVAKQAGQLEGKALAAGHDSGLADILIAATAKAHDLTVLTWNLRDFRPIDVRVQTPEDITS